MYCSLISKRSATKHVRLERERCRSCTRVVERPPRPPPSDKDVGGEGSPLNTRHELGAAARAEAARLAAAADVEPRLRNGLLHRLAAFGCAEVNREAHLRRIQDASRAGDGARQEWATRTRHAAHGGKTASAQRVSTARRAHEHRARPMGSHCRAHLHCSRLGRHDNRRRAPKWARRCARRVCTKCTRRAAWLLVCASSILFDRFPDRHRRRASVSYRISVCLSSFRHHYIYRCSSSLSPLWPSRRLAGSRRSHACQ